MWNADIDCVELLEVVLKNQPIKHRVACTSSNQLNYVGKNFITWVGISFIKKLSNIKISSWVLRVKVFGTGGNPPNANRCIRISLQGYLTNWTLLHINHHQPQKSLSLLFAYFCLGKHCTYLFHGIGMRNSWGPAGLVLLFDEHREGVWSPRRLITCYHVNVINVLSKISLLWIGCCSKFML